MNLFKTKCLHTEPGLIGTVLELFSLDRIEMSPECIVLTALRRASSLREATRLHNASQLSCGNYLI